MSGTAFHTDRVPACDDVVSALLSGHPLGQPVSTRSLLTDFRAAAPTSLDTDDEIVASVVRIATGRSMAVVFDHRVPADHASTPGCGPNPPIDASAARAREPSKRSPV